MITILFNYMRHLLGDVITPGLRAPAVISAMLFMLADITSAADGAARAMPPSASEQKAASALVREVFGTEAAKAVTPEAKSILAGKLIDQATDGVSPTEAYVLLSSAWRLAAEAGDINSATRAIDLLESQFILDEAELTFQCLEHAVNKAFTTELHRVVDHLLELSRNHTDEERFNAATSAATLAALAAKRAGDNARRQACAEQLNTIKSLIKKTKEIQSLIDRIGKDPADTDAAYQLGKVRCFEQGRWEDGLPLLARGRKGDLPELAKMDLDGSGTPLLIGDTWWAFGDNDGTPHAAAARSRAAFHYTKALPILKGLERARIEKRLETLATAEVRKPRSRRSRPAAKGLVLWLDASDMKSLQPSSGNAIDKAGGPTRIAAWADLSGRGGSASQDAPNRQPTWTPKGIGELPAVEFNGSTGLVVNIPCPSTGTLIVVAKPRTAKICRLVGCHPDTGESKGHVDVSFRADGTFLLEATTLNNVTVQTKNTYVAGEPHAIAASWGKALTLLIDDNGPDHTTLEDRITPLRGPWGIGITNEKNTSFSFDGWISELHVYDRELEAAERHAVVQQLLTKWGISH